jgi:hypothetical protein
LLRAPHLAYGSRTKVFACASASKEIKAEEARRHHPERHVAALTSRAPVLAIGGAPGWAAVSPTRSSAAPAKITGARVARRDGHQGERPLPSEFRYLRPISSSSPTCIWPAAVG